MFWNHFQKQAPPWILSKRWRFNGDARLNWKFYLISINQHWQSISVKRMATVGKFSQISVGVVKNDWWNISSKSIKWLNNNTTLVCIEVFLTIYVNHIANPTKFDEFLINFFINRFLKLFIWANLRIIANLYYSFYLFDQINLKSSKIT